MYFIILHHLVAILTRSGSVITRYVYWRLSASRVYMRAVICRRYSALRFIALQLVGLVLCSRFWWHHLYCIDPSPDGLVRHCCLLAASMSPLVLIQCSQVAQQWPAILGIFDSSTSQWSLLALLPRIRNVPIADTDGTAPCCLFLCRCVCTVVRKMMGLPFILGRVRPNSSSDVRDTQSTHSRKNRLLLAIISHFTKSGCIKYSLMIA